VAATVGGLAEAVGLSDFAVAGRHALTGGDSGRELEKDELVGDDDHCDQLLALGNRTGSRSLRWRSRFVADEALHGIAEIVPPAPRSTTATTALGSTRKHAEGSWIGLCFRSEAFAGRERPEL
jgi:hypothetical protein